VTHVKLMQQIKNNQIPSIILLFGTESYFIQDVQQTLIAQMSQSEDDFISTYDLEETPIEAVIDDAETYPFFSEKKLIIVEKPFFLTNKRADTSFEHNVNRLEQYLENPAPYSTMLFIAPYETLDKRKKIVKQFHSTAYVAECQPIQAREMGKWINNIAKELNITINKDVLPILEGELSNDLHVLENEMEKLALFVGENGVVTKEIAYSLISQTIDGSALRLVDAIINRDLVQAMNVQQMLEKMNEEKVSLIALLAFQFRVIYQAKLLKQRGYSEFQMRQEISAHPYVIKLANQRERSFSKQQLEHYIDKIAETDALIKRGKMDDRLAFELLIYELVMT